MKIYEHYPLAALHTFGVAVTARYYGVLSTLEDVELMLHWQRTHPDLPTLLLGGGSNLLFTADYPGLVVKVELYGRRVLGEDATYAYLHAGAGENWHDFVRWSIAQGYAGLENLSLIPGTVGAAPIQNIGAYGIELKDCLHAVQAVDKKTGAVREFERGDCQFGYRDSYFKSVEPGRWLISAVVFRLPLRPQWCIDYAGVREQLADVTLTAVCISDAIIALRRQKLPDPVQLANAGSFFKNPVIAASQWETLHQQFADMPYWSLADQQYKLSAGWLIDRCGWKGQRVGDVGTYEKHALVLVNYGAASGQEIWRFAQQIICSVNEMFGIQLEPEPLVMPRSIG